MTAFPEREVRPTARIVPLFAILALVLQVIDPRPAWLMLCVALGTALLVAWLWARALSRGLRLTRELRYGWTQVGDQLEERFTVENTALAPALWLELSDHSTLPDYHVARATGVGGRSATAWETAGICTRRGLYRLGPTTLRCGDPLGLFTVTIRDAQTATLVVMPPVVPLPSVDVAPGGRAGEGRRTRETAEFSVNTSRVREMQPGDSRRWIHWRVSAHRADWYVRVQDSTPAGDWWIVLDANRAVQAGTGPQSTLEYGVILAASLADRGLREGRSVGLVANGAASAVMTPLGGEAQRWAIMRSLTLVAEGAQPLAELLTRMRTVFRQASSLVIITPDDSDDWPAALLPLMQGGITPTVLRLDRRTFGAPDSGGATVLLSGLGVTCHSIERGLLDLAHSRPGQRGRTRWHIGGTGRAVPVEEPTDRAWRPLAADARGRNAW